MTYPIQIRKGAEGLPRTSSVVQSLRLRVGFGSRVAIRLLIPLMIAFTFLPDVGQAGETASTNFVPARKPMSAPAGFQNVCMRFNWACQRGSGTETNAESMLKLAQSVNSRINRGTRQVSDQRQFGTEDFWTLPTSRGGDCEDFVLLKKMHLIKNGISADHLLIATVLDRQRSPHAVLVLRTGAGDFVLDNLRNKIKRWHETGYTFLRMQNPDSPNSWDAVFAGGAFS